MLHLRSDDRLDALASGLSEVLRTPMSDPMSPEWIVVGSAGIGRWLGLQLSLGLGSSGPEATDGIAANLDLLYPGRLTQRVLDPQTSSDADPWQVDRLTWSVLAVRAAQHHPGTGAVATPWSQARRIADNFDRYILHRPHMIRSWVRGDDVDGAGMRLDDSAVWQAELFRAVHALIGIPSPAERLPALVEALADGEVPAGVPERVSLFGLTTIPGGEPFLEVVDALATQRDVHLYLHQPSASLADAVHLDRAVPRGSGSRPERIVAAACHPLLGSWARPAVDAVVTLGSRFDARRVEQRAPSATAPDARPSTVLAQLQHDIRSNTAPSGAFRPAPGDTSLRIHSCHGPTRQVQVLRDQILHLLADDPDLSEDDIVVLCPSLTDFAPLIEATWGPSAKTAAAPSDHVTGHERSAPALAYRITDRSLGSTSPMLAALASLVELLGSRFSDVAVQDFLALPSVRERFDLGDQELLRIQDWVEAANTRWGLDGVHRQRWGLPSDFDDGTWSAAIDRLLVGIMASDDPTSSGPGGLVPISVEGSDVALAGRLGEALASLRSLRQRAAHAQPIDSWLALLHDATRRLLAPARGAQWQLAQLTNALAELGERSRLGDQPCPVDVSLAELCALLGQYLTASGGRSDFFRGGITVTSLTPLRGVPFRVVCLLGVDESAFTTISADGDDLMAVDPVPGDRDRRADTRQALLDAVLCAGSHLVLTRSGHSVVTNQPTPPAVVVAELADAVEAMFDPEVRTAALETIQVTHPRQGHDERNFIAGAVDGHRSVPWGFDPLGRDGALRRRSPSHPAPFLDEPLELDRQTVIELDALRSFLDAPVRYFLQNSLGITLRQLPSRLEGRQVDPSLGAGAVPRAADGRNLVLELDSLEAWKLADRLLVHRRSGGDLESFRRRELATGSLPPGRLAERAIDDAADKVEPIIGHLDQLGVLGSQPSQRPIDVTLRNGTRIVGTVRDDGGEVPGPVLVTASKWHERRMIGPWLDLLALNAEDPAGGWSASLVACKKVVAGFGAGTIRFPDVAPPQRRQRAVDALEVVVDLFQRGRCEPLPLFPETSAQLARDKSATSAWRDDYNARGEGFDRWVQFAFGELSFDQLLALRCRDGDPPGRGDSRALRYASVLWEAYDTSIADVDDRVEVVS